jgi:hypothetical protein
MTFAVEIRHPLRLATTAGDNEDPTNVRRSSLDTPSKISVPNSGMVDGICSSVKPEQPEKAPSRIAVTLDGIQSCLMAEQPVNA